MTNHPRRAGRRKYQRQYAAGLRTIGQLTCPLCLTIGGGHTDDCLIHTRQLWAELTSTLRVAPGTRVYVGSTR